MNNSSTPPNRPRPAVTAVIIIVMIGMVAAAIVALNHKDSTSNTSAMTTAPLTTATPSVSTTPVTNSSSSSSYKDGTYTAAGTYFTPDGQETINVTLTIANNIVTNSITNEQALSGEGQRYQDQFAANYKSQVVGKNVDSISLSRVAGSSLTSTGFNDALSQIRQKAVS